MKKSLIKIIAVTVIIALLLGTGVLAVEDINNVNPGYYDITYFGGLPDDGIDDTSAFKHFVSVGTIYLPEGEYTVTDTIGLSNQSLVGAGSEKTIITADITDSMRPIIQTSRTVNITGVTIRFKDGLVTGEETEGQRVGILGAGKYALQRGSKFTDVKIENVGTGIASGIGDSVLNYKNIEDQIFSVTFDQFVINDFSFRGFDWRSNARTGNYFKDVTVSSGKFRADSAVYWTGEESETAVGKLTVKDTVAETPLYFERVHNLSANEIVLDNVYSLHYPIVTWESSSGVIDKLTFDYCDTHFQENPLFSIGKTQYIQSHIQTLNRLHIGTLKLNSFNSNNAKNIFKRSENETDPFYIAVDEYIVKNSDFEWNDFPSDEKNLYITKKGNIATEGTTEERPEECLCPYYSLYYDTTLHKTVIWNGEEWK